MNRRRAGFAAAQAEAREREAHVARLLARRLAFTGRGRR